jgi:hypothetical protein
MPSGGCQPSFAFISASVSIGGAWFSEDRTEDRTLSQHPHRTHDSPQSISLSRAGSAPRAERDSLQMGPPGLEPGTNEL